MACALLRDSELFIKSIARVNNELRRVAQKKALQDSGFYIPVNFDCVSNNSSAPGR